MYKKRIKQVGEFILEAKKSLGQNFLNSPEISDFIVQEIKKKEYNYNLHEIGPGSGVLTSQLLLNNFHVIAIEKDSRAVQGLKDIFSSTYKDKFVIYNVDVLKWVPIDNNNFLIGNIPYYITSDILMWYMKYRKHYKGAIFMLQKEVAERLCAKPSTKDYSRLTVRMQLNFFVNYLKTVPKELFVPKPSVDSALIEFLPKEEIFTDIEEEHKFEIFTAQLFSARRKMLRGTIKKLNIKNFEGKQQSIWQKLNKYNIKPEDRPDAINPNNIFNLFKIINQE